MKKYLISNSGNFYKANLHCHTTCSDGKLTPERIKEEYSKRGYSVVAYTDHDILLNRQNLTDENFLALNGYEMEVNQRWEGNFSLLKTCHMCFIALSPNNLTQVCYHREKYLFGNAPLYRKDIQFNENLPDFERVYSHECISEMMQTGRDNGFFVTYNHPAWSLETIEDFKGYNGMHAMEICNYGCVEAGYNDYNEKEYDQLLSCGKRIYCVATDDNHNAKPLDSARCDSFGGFTMIKAPALTYTDITTALLKGDFYASQGPEINELFFEDGKITVKCSPAKNVTLNTGRRRTEIVRQETEPVTQATFNVLPEDNYVRITVTDANGKNANTNAYFCSDLLN